MQTSSGNQRIGLTTRRMVQVQGGDEGHSAPAMREKIKSYLHKTPKKVRPSLENPSTELDNSVLCNLCKQPIEGVVVEALGVSWHQAHFVCTECKKPITASKFNVHEGKAYCEQDYAMYFLKKCANCKEPITDVVISALNQNWHKHHFTCKSCGILLSDSGFFEMKNNPYCQLCYEKNFMPKCQQCEQPIVETALMALGQRWHRSCFLCQVCGKPITDSTFEVMNNCPTCSSCSSQI